MRIPILSKLMWLGVGGGIVALMFGRRRAPAHDDMAADPADPVQDPEMVDPLDPLDDLDVDAMSMIDRDVDVEGTSSVEDRIHPDDDTAMDDGQTWIEALETSSTENGPRPEQPLDSIVDDQDIHAAPLVGDGEDTPVADRGSGGPAGM